MKPIFVKLRVTEYEHELFMKLAADMDLSMSDYIRHCCLLFPPKLDKNK